MGTRWTAGDRFGRYRIEGLLGRGGMGEVYLAEDTQLGRRVALKILHGAGDDAKLLREARAAAAIDHPNVARVFDVDTVEGVPFLAMELVEGKSLRTYVGDESVTLETKVKWLVAIGRALDAAHARGIVHRDVKPENVIVGDDGVVKVLDFGIARVVPIVDRGAETRTGPGTPGPVVVAAAADVEGVPGATKGTTVKGTLAYMAPEQIRGETIDASADQWAWGVVAYELLTGLHPWRASRDELALVAEILSREPEPMRGAAQRFDLVVRQAMEKRRADRFSSLLSALGAIRGAQDELPTGGRTWMTAPIALTLALTACVGALSLLRLENNSFVEMTRPTSPVVDEGHVEPPDFGSPMSENAEALGAYVKGIEATRNAETAPFALSELSRARKLDRNFAAASLRSLLLMRPGEGGTDILNDLLPRRDQLGHHDQAILEAIEPWFRSPHDPRLLRERLAVLDSGNDPDFATQHCTFLRYMSAWGEARDVCRIAQHLDPDVASNYFNEGLSLQILGESIEAQLAFEECLKHSTHATRCMHGLADLASLGGRCEEYVRLVNRMAFLSPNDAELVRPCAFGAFSLDFPKTRDPVSFRSSSEAYVRTLTIQGASLQEITTEKAFHQSIADIANGDLNKGLQQLEKIVGIYRPNGREAEIASIYALQLSILMELDRRKEGVTLAKKWLAQREAWVASTLVDTRIYPWAALHALGAIPDHRFRDLRREWRESASTQASGSRSSLWVAAYSPIASVEDAREALAAMKDFGPFPQAGEDILIDATLGAALLAAGQTDGALIRLQAATSACWQGALWVTDYTQAFRRLGDALATQGQIISACDAYGVVLLHWGATRASVTAQAARRARAALKCPPYLASVR